MRSAIKFSQLDRIGIIDLEMNYFLIKLTMCHVHVLSILNSLLIYLDVWLADTSTGTRIAIVEFKNPYREVQHVITFSLTF
jgi:hypothetical protein